MSTLQVSTFLKQLIALNVVGSNCFNLRVIISNSSNFSNILKLISTMTLLTEGLIDEFLLFAEPLARAPTVEITNIVGEVA